MADRNPNIPSERAQDVESRTHINEDDANRRFADKQAKLQRKAHRVVAPPVPEQEGESAKEGDDA